MKKYICPMHPEVSSGKPGRCPKCGMALELENSNQTNHHMKTNSSQKTTLKDYMPLIVVIGLILLSTLTLTFKDIVSQSFILSKTLSYFMIGFFLTFAGFKLIDLKGFASGYSTYDLLAKKWFSYGYIYPFIELFFGLSMIVGIYQTQILWAELAIMSFSGVGVAIKLLKKERFQCACLGTFLKVPLTKVTLIEDFGMAFLALVMLILK